MNSWEELCCFSCGMHLGWMAYSGPHGSTYCDECKRADDERTQPEDAQHG